MRAYEFENISHTADRVRRYMKRHGVRPGTPAWFRLWFARPYLTGEQPMGRRR